jgi:3-dehydroquinate synthase
MKQLQVVGSTVQSKVVIGESITSLRAYCNGKEPVIITDRTVRSLHGHRFPSGPVIEVGEGEGSKTLRTVEEVYGAFLRNGVDRSSLVVGIGGGIVCDVAGFAASTYLRGIPFGFVPTTLLAQVDASVGGKNGVNLSGYKNLIGTFTQPSFVLCDGELLSTLPKEEVINGFAEVVKQAAIGDPNLFALLEGNVDAALALAPSVIERVVHDSLRVKIAVVSRDEKETGERRKLNLGHTIGHGLEKVHHLRHGEAVSVGMVAAARLSVRQGLLSNGDAVRLENLLVRFGLPVRMTIDIARVIDAVQKDKKRAADIIHFVLLDGIGSARIVPIPITEIEGVLDDLCESRRE